MSVPKYLKIRDAILADIRSGYLKKGDKLPKREELIEKYSVTRTTIDKALGELIKSGVLNSTRRLGTFVASPDIPLKVAVVSRFSGKLPDKETVVGQSDMQQLFRALISSSSGMNLSFIDRKDAMQNKKFHSGYDVVAWMLPGERELDALRDISYKTIVSNRYYDDLNFVSTNHRAAIEEMTSHYIEKCGDDAQLFYLGWDREDFVTAERKEGFIDACSRHNRFYRFCPMTTSSAEKNYESLMKLEISKDKPVIMVAGSCNMTGAALKMASAKGLKLWDNLFYADFDNADSLERTGVQVTTALQDYYTMGIELVKSFNELGDKPIRKFTPYRLVGLR